MRLVSINLGNFSSVCSRKGLPQLAGGIVDENIQAPMTLDDNVQGVVPVRLFGQVHLNVADVAGSQGGNLA